MGAFQSATWLNVLSNDGSQVAGGRPRWEVSISHAPRRVALLDRGAILHFSQRHGPAMPGINHVHQVYVFASAGANRHG